MIGARAQAMLAALAVAALPVPVRAQIVPAIAASPATAQSGGHAAASAAAVASSEPTAMTSVPPGPPPPVRLLSPSAPLTAKERHGVALAHHWARRPVMPHPGPDGVIRFLYGATMPTVVCAPLRVCDLALQPGEVVNNINIGDKVRWNVLPGVSGAGSALTTHVMIKPDDAGLISNLIIQTDRRTYAVKLVSTQSEWMPLVGFNYPSEAATAWQQYRATVGQSAIGMSTGDAASAFAANASGADLQFYCMSPRTGGPSWHPLRVYTDGRKTYIDFPSVLSGMAAPALVALGNDGGWFSSPTPQVVNYRIIGHQYVVDSVLDHAALISGVGGSQDRVVLRRGCG